MLRMILEYFRYRPAYVLARDDNIDFRSNDRAKEKGIESIALLKTLFGGQKMPAVKPPATMPDPNDELLMRRKRQQAASAMSTSGRASTILSDTSDTLGG